MRRPASVVLPTKEGQTAPGKAVETLGKTEGKDVARLDRQVARAETHLRWGLVGRVIQKRSCAQDVSAIKTIQCAASQGRLALSLCRKGSDQNIAHDFRRLDASKTLIEALVFERELFVVDSELMQNGRVEVPDVDGVLDDVV